MVAAVDMTDSLRRLRSLQLPTLAFASTLLLADFDTGERSLGLLEADVAIANAAAAVDVLLLSDTQ